MDQDTMEVMLKEMEVIIPCPTHLAPDEPAEIEMVPEPDSWRELGRGEASGSMWQHRAVRRRKGPGAWSWVANNRETSGGWWEESQSGYSGSGRQQNPDQEVTYKLLGGSQEYSPSH